MGLGRDTATKGQHAETGAARAHLAGVQFLVFELHGQRYGVDVAEIEAIVQATALRRQGETSSYEGKDLPSVQTLERWVGLTASQPTSTEDPSATDAPPHLLLSRSSGGLNGLLVDMPRDIVSLPLESIYALPPLIRHLLPDSPLWGVGQAEDGLILLVDPARRGRSRRRREIESEEEL